MARKRLNKNLVVALTLFGFVAIILVSVVVLSQLQRGDPQHFVALAEENEKNEQWEIAAEYYRRAWVKGQDPANLIRFGSMLLNSGEVREALRCWEEALVSNPGLLDAHTRKLEVLLELSRLYGSWERWRSVQEAADAMLQAVGEEGEADAAFAYNAKGMALINLEAQDASYADEGLAALEEATTLAPEVADYKLELARQHIRRDEVDIGEGILQDLLESYSAPGAEASQVRVAYARYLAGKGRWEDALGYLGESTALAGNEPEALFDAKLAQAGLLGNRWLAAMLKDPDAPAPTESFEEAEVLLKDCINSDAEAFEPYMQLARLYKFAGRHADVVAVCDQRLEPGFSRKGVEGQRNRLNAFQLMLLASESCVNQALEFHTSRDDEAYEESLGKARQYVEQANGEYPNHPRVLSLSGRIKLSRGLDRAALEDFRKVDDAYRSRNVVDWETKLRLARLHLKLNEPGAAKSVLEDVIDQVEGRRGVPVWLLYARILFANDEANSPQLDRALAQVFLVDPDNSDAKRVQAAVLERQGRSKHAREVLDGFPTASALLEMRERALEGDTEGALSVLMQALEENPTDARLVSSTVHELLTRDRVSEAQDIVQRALAARPDDLTLQRIALMADPGLSPEQREQALLEIIELEPDTYQRTWDLIAFHWRRNDATKVLEHLEQAERHLDLKDTAAAREAAVDQLRALLKLKMRVAAQLDNSEALLAARDSAAAHNVDGANGKSFLGLYHLYQNEIDLAIKAFGEAIAVQPTDTATLTHLAQCLQRVGRAEDARTYYERAIRINPAQAAAHKGLAVLAKARGDTDSFDEHLRMCQRLIPADPWIKEELLAKQEQQDPREAIERRKALLQNNPDDAANLMRLAVLSESVNDPAAAQGYYERLVELRPEDKNLIAAVSRFHIRDGHPEQSLSLVTRYADAKTTDEDKANAQIIVAAHYLSLDDLDLATATLLAAADTAETFDVCNSLGEFYLRTLGDPKEALRWFDRAAELARKEQSPRLPQILAVRIGCLLTRRIDDIETARTLVEELKEQFPQDPKGWLLDSEVHAREGHTDQAVRALSEYLLKRPNEPYALFQRAQYYRLQGRLGAAIEDLETIKRSSPLALKLEPRLLLAHLHRNAGHIDAWIRELESIAQDAPNSPWALEALVRGYISEERFPEADRIVTAQINSAPGRPDKRWFFLRGHVSLALEEYNKALADFDRGAAIDDYSSDSVARVLNVYLLAGRFADGARFFEEHGPKEKRTARVVSLNARLQVHADLEARAVKSFRTAMALAVSESFDAVRAVSADLQAAFDSRDASGLFEREPPSGESGRANDRILVRLYQIADRIDDAIAKLEQLTRTAVADKERAALLFEKGNLYQLVDQPGSARTAYEEALKYDSDNWVILNNIAYILSDDLGEHQLALPYARRAAELADTPSTLDTLGWIYVGLMNYPQAVAELNRAIQLDPDQALPYYHLGEAYRLGGQFIEAADILKRGQQAASKVNDAQLVQLIDVSLDKTERRESTQ